MLYLASQDNDVKSMSICGRRSDSNLCDCGNAEEGSYVTEQGLPGCEEPWTRPAIMGERQMDEKPQAQTPATGRDNDVTSNHSETEMLQA